MEEFKLPKVLAISISTWHKDSGIHTQTDLFKYWDPDRHTISTQNGKRGTGWNQRLQGLRKIQGFQLLSRIYNTNRFFRHGLHEKSWIINEEYP